MLALAGCATPTRVQAPARSPSEVRAQLQHLIPADAADRQGWAADIQIAFSSLQIEPSDRHLCAALAVAEQESSFVSDPVVPGLGKIARAEIDRRAGAHHIPGFVVSAALAIKSSNGMSYNDRIASVRTERELSLVYEDLISRVPLGQTLFADDNPVKTGGPMQVSVTFAESYAKQHTYPYNIDGSIRHEVFSRRGSLYFGIAHLLGYPVSYDNMIFRFADFNAGFYSSRNAAFQSAISLASGLPLALDGDLVDYEHESEPGKTELAVRSLAKNLGMSEADIHRTLALDETLDLEKTPLYSRVYELAEKMEHKPLPRAMLPQIDLSSPKITRKFTTGMYATRVDQRYRACLAKTTSN